MMSNLPGELQYSGRRLSIGDTTFDTEYPIQEATLLTDKIIVLHNPYTGPTSYGQFRNLIAYDLHGQKVWTAEHPGNDSNDVYMKIVKSNPLTVHNFAGFECVIDSATGKIIKKIFTK